MGMYTEFVFACEINKDTPDDVIDILKFMVNKSDEKEPMILPTHEFFKCDRWRFLFSMDSYYFSGTTHSELEKDEYTEGNNYYLTVRSNLKNYNSEIRKFCDWISEYIRGYDRFLGYSRYEECDDPELIYIKEGNIVFK